MRFAAFSSYQMFKLLLCWLFALCCSLLPANLHLQQPTLLYESFEIVQTARQRRACALESECFARTMLWGVFLLPREMWKLPIASKHLQKHQMHEKVNFWVTIWLFISRYSVWYLIFSRKCINTHRIMGFVSVCLKRWFAQQCCRSSSATFMKLSTWNCVTYTQTCWKAEVGHRITDL